MGCQTLTMGPSDSNYTQQFHLFPELPYDLRALIWRFSFCRPIQVQLELGTGSIPALLPEHIQGLCSFSYDKNTTPPALLTCKESRDTALSSYDCFPPRKWKLWRWKSVPSRQA